jgi:hypothetical protein
MTTKHDLWLDDLRMPSGWELLSREEREQDSHEWVTTYADAIKALATGPCPTCNAPTVQRVGKFGLFYGCTKYPECKGTLEFNPNDIPSPGPRRKLKPKLFPVIEALPGLTVPLDPKLNATVPPLPPDLVDEPDDDTVEQDDDDFLFDD